MRFKFIIMSSEIRKKKRRSPKHYYLLLQTEKHMFSVVRNILPKNMAVFLCKAGFSVAYLYGLPKSKHTRINFQNAQYYRQRIHTTTLWQSGLWPVKATLFSPIYHKQLYFVCWWEERSKYPEELSLGFIRCD